MWIAGPPERAGAGYVWGTLGKNEGRGYGVEGGRASEASHLESPGIWRAAAVWDLGVLSCGSLGEVALFTGCRRVAHWLSQGCGPWSAEVREIRVSTCCVFGVPGIYVKYRESGYL